jgi:serine protease Do
VEPWTANLLGLGLGSAISAAALAIGLPMLQGPAQQPETPAAVQPVAPPAATPAPPPRPSTMRRPAAAVLPPMELPPSGPPQANALPNIIYPEPIPEPPPDVHGTHQPGTGVTGTGFFVASDGSIVTAAHVVDGCRRTRIASRLVKPANVQLIAADTGHDIALLRASHLTPPATLSVGHPAAPNGRLFVLGYPATGGPLIPTETWAVLENGQFPPAPSEFTDPRRVIWASAPEVNHGFSGGPMLDPRNGEVVGIIRGMVDSSRLHALRASIPSSGVVTGPGSALLSSLLQQEGTNPDATAFSGDDAIDAARRATVHVICLY